MRFSVTYRDLQVKGCDNCKKNCKEVNSIQGFSGKCPRREDIEEYKISVVNERKIIRYILKESQ